MKDKQHLKHFTQLMNSFEPIKRKKENYDFYFGFGNYDERYVKTVFCKYPKMTAVYKQLKNSFDCGFIHKFGYSQSLPF